MCIRSSCKLLFWAIFALEKACHCPRSSLVLLDSEFIVVFIENSDLMGLTPLLLPFLVF